MDKCREAFESKGNIKIFVKLCVFDDSINEYSSEKLHDYTLGFINGAWWAWQEQQKRIDELSQENKKLRLDHAAYKKGVKNIIREKQKQVDFIEAQLCLLKDKNKATEIELTDSRAHADALQARVDGAYVKLAMLRQTELWQEDDIYELFEELEQALKGGEV